MGRGLKKPPARRDGSDGHMRRRDITLVAGLVILVVLLFGLFGGGMMGFGGAGPWD